MMTKVILVANTDWYLFNFRRALAHFLRDQGFVITLVSPAGKFVYQLKEDDFRWIEWRLGRQTIAPWRELPAIIALTKIYKSEHPDLIHHHTIKPVLYGSVAARLAGAPAVVNSITGRGYIFLSKDSKASLLKWITLPFYRMTFSHPDQAVIFENDEDRQYFIRERLIPAERTRLIAGVGVDTDRFVPAPEQPGTPVVLLSSRMLWDKGVGVLVEAARRLRQTTAVRVALVGAPDPGNPASISEEQLQAWAAEGLIEWWGWQADMNAVYQRSHIVTLPTMYGEGVPTALLEGAACGRPLVATDMPGCRDIVLDQFNGLIVPPNDPVALADALGKLLADPALRGRMGSAGRQLVLQKFTVSYVNHSTLSVYQELLKRPKRKY
jgi:glycosyltransferase involved in cell wall biosynthesis